MADEAEDLTTFDDEALEEQEEQEPTEELEEETDASEEDEGEEEDDKWRPEFDERTQAFLDKRIIAPRVAKETNLRNELQEARQRIQQLEQRIPQDAPPEVPPMPVAWDEDYEEQIAARDQALIARAAWDRDQKERLDNEAAQEQQKVRTFVDAVKRSTANYNASAKRAGISSEDLRIAGDVVQSEISSPDLVLHLLDHEHGPALTVYLSEHPDQLEKVRSMSPLKAATYIDREIVPKASTRRKSPPPPPRRPSGGSGGKGVDPLIKGATFE